MSVARVAWGHGINANQVFGWRRLYLAGRLGERKPAMKLLPVRVSESLPEPLPVERSSADLPKPQPGTIHIELRQARCASKAVPMRRWCACCWSAYRFRFPLFQRDLQKCHYGSAIDIVPR